MYKITDYGAVGDGVTLNTVAINRAIEECYNNGGGKVVVPAGRFLSGTITLKSNIELHLEAGAVLLGSTNIADYIDLDGGHKLTLHNTPIIFSYYRRPFIYAVNAENVAVTGMGKIDGQGGWQINFPNEGDETNSRPIIMIMNNVKKLRITDITMVNPSMWTTRFEYCVDVDIRGVTIWSMRTNNGDGLDFVGGSNIRISDCHIEAGDCISLKMFDKGDEIKNVTVTNCTMKSWWCGLRIGAETDDNCYGLTMTNCVIDCSGDGIKIHSCGGSVIENMIFSNIVMRNVERPVFMVADTYTFNTNASCRPGKSVIRNITFSNIISTHNHDLDYQRYVGDKIPGSVISGSYSGSIENISFENVMFEAEGGVSDESLADPVVYEFVDYMDKYAEAREFRRICVPASGLFLRRVKNCTFRNVRLKSRQADVRPRLIALRCENCLFDVTAESDQLCSRPILAEKVDCCEFCGTSASMFTEDERTREQENDRIYRAVYDLQPEEAALVDAARSMPCDTVITGEKTADGKTFKFNFEKEPKKAYVYFAWAKGRADFYCNGVKIGEHKFPTVDGYRRIMIDFIDHPEYGLSGVFADKFSDYYEREYYCAFEITSQIKAGENVIEVKCAGFEDKWPVHILYER